ncbi:MAG TPA: hypothetical protein VFB25_06910 [Gaiellaceae bacterium]|nr:hypothetical protein [Gaiellaceae bacterium]
MSDDIFDLLTSFRADAPYPDDETWERVRRHQGPTPRVRGRRRAAIAIALCALVLTGGSIAAYKETPWWQSGAPPVDPQSVASVARDNMPANVDVADARTVAQDGDAALVAVPLDTTGYCLIPSLGGTASLGASCDYQVTNVEQGTDDETASVSRPQSSSDPADWIVYGRITDPRAAKVDLGAFTVTLTNGGFFLAHVPEQSWTALNDTANRGRILDSSGAVLRTGCVNWGLDPAKTDPQREGVELWLDTKGPCTPQLPPPIPTLDMAHATKLFDVTLTQQFSLWKAGTTVSFVSAPASDGSTCVTVTGPTEHPLPNVGGDCLEPNAGWNGTTPVEVGFSAQRVETAAGAVYDWVLEGRTNPAAQVAKIVLESPSGATTATIGGDYYFLQFPQTSPSADDLPAGPYTLKAYDAAGNLIQSTDLSALHAQEVPH